MAQQTRSGQQRSEQQRSGQQRSGQQSGRQRRSGPRRSGWRSALGGAVAAVGIVVLAGCAGAAAPEPDQGPGVIVPGRPGEQAQIMSGEEAAQRRAPEAVSPADAVFIAMMVPHHEQALAMAALAPQRASSPQVAAMAERIAGVQGPEIDVLRAWLERHAADPVVGAHGHAPLDAAGGHTGMPGMATPAQLDALAAAGGPAFDRMFLDLMIAHHEGALQMAGQAQLAGSDITAQQIADDVVATQSVDIARMRELYPPG